jgi:hypothetical protein
MKLSKKCKVKVLPQRRYLDDLHKFIDELFEEAAVQKGWSLERWANLAGCSPGTVSRLRWKITVYPRFHTIWKLAKPLGYQVMLKKPEVVTRQRRKRA